MTEQPLPAYEPAGFPRCPQCPYMRMGPARICVQCAAATLEPVDAAVSCPVCSQFLGQDGRCPNWLCADPGRRITRIGAISYLSGELRHPILRFKYDGKSGWSLIFGRLVVGWLEAHAAADPPELIVANPKYRAPGDAPGHVETIIAAAVVADAEQRWPFDIRSGPPAIIKTGPTGQSAGASAAAKRAVAAELRRVLRIPDPAVTRGRRILVVDDVCTTGSQLDSVADCLLRDGAAAEVSGLVLARAPWRS